MKHATLPTLTTDSFSRTLFSKWPNKISDSHRRRKVKNIGGPRFRILGGGGGGARGGGGKFPVVMTSMRRNNVASMSFRRHVPTRFLINQCQIITVLILKSDIIENSRIELRAIVLPVPSNQIKVAFIIILPFNLVHL